MAIHTICPSCSFPYVLADDLAGQPFICTACDTEFSVPEPAPAPLPPIAATDPYHRISRTRKPILLLLLGIGTDTADTQSKSPHVLSSFGQPFLLLALFAATIICSTSQTTALLAAPAFFGATVILFLLGYLIAVAIAQREMGESPQHVNLLSRLLLQPLVLLFADARSAMPALRAFFVGGCLAIATLLLGFRAGSVATVIPRLSFNLGTPRQAAAHSTPAISGPKVVTFGHKGSEDANPKPITLILDKPSPITKPAPPPDENTPPPPPNPPSPAHTSPPPPPAE